MTKARAICCVCKKFLHWTNTSDGRDSHSYCPKHFEEAMREAEKWFQQQIEARVAERVDEPAS